MITDLRAKMWPLHLWDTNQVHHVRYRNLWSVEFIHLKLHLKWSGRDLEGRRLGYGYSSAESSLPSGRMNLSAMLFLGSETVLQPVGVHGFTILRARLLNTLGLIELISIELVWTSLLKGSRNFCTFQFSQDQYQYGDRVNTSSERLKWTNTEMYHFHPVICCLIVATVRIIIMSNISGG
jgi:hypothetical protein